MKNYLNFILVSFAGLLASEATAQLTVNDSLASAGILVSEEIKTKANGILMREILYPLNYDALRPFSRVGPMPIKERQFSCQLAGYDSGNMEFQLLIKRLGDDVEVLFATGYVDLDKEQVFFHDAKKDDYILAKNYQKFIDALPRSQASTKKFSDEPSKTSKKSG